VLGSADQNGQAENEQNVPDDRSRNRSLNHAGKSLGQCDAGNNELRGIPESRVQQSAQPFAYSRRELFGGAANPTGHGNDCDSRTNEKRRWIRETGPKAKDERNRDEKQEPVQRRFHVHEVIG